MVILKICLFSAFVIWAILEGIKDAYLFHYQSSSVSKKTPPHALFTAHRLIIGGLVAWITKDWLFCLSLALVFSFIHNSAYFEYRHRINSMVYPKGWKDDSTTSTAMFDFSFFVRLSLAMIGAVLLVVNLIL